MKTDNNTAKTTKKKRIFFGGDFLVIDAQLKSNIQKILNKALPNGFIVSFAMVTTNEVTVKIFRNPKYFYTTDPDYTNIDDLAILSGELEKAKVCIPLGPLPYVDCVNYQIYVPSIRDSYNDLMKVHGYQELKDLVIDSTDKCVVYHYRFK